MRATSATYHAHLLATTRRMGAEGLTGKTRELDAMQTRGAEVTAMRELWAELQNNALERAGGGGAGRPSLARGRSGRRR